MDAPGSFALAGFRLGEAALLVSKQATPNHEQSLCLFAEKQLRLCRRCTPKLLKLNGKSHCLSSLNSVPDPEPNPPQLGIDMPTQFFPGM